MTLPCLAARRAALLSAIGLVFACVDNPTEVFRAPPDGPRAIWYPATAPVQCTQPNCLMDDVIGAWSVTGTQNTTYTYVPEDPSPATSAGTLLNGRWCTYHNGTGEFRGCQDPHNWIGGQGAVRPDRKVIFIARNAANNQRLTFTSYAPEPQLEVLEWERPDPVVCSGSNCNGPFRIKVQVRNAGWYTSDRIAFAVENSAGSRWPLTTGPPTDTIGDIAEWRWASLWTPGAGSKLVVEYRPWNGFDDLKQEVRLPINGASPSLTLTAAPTTVTAGDPVTFTPAANGAALIEVLSWTWTPDQAPGNTAACSPGTDPCITTVHENGTMVCNARVDGHVRSASARVSCSATSDSVLNNKPLRQEMYNALVLSGAYNPDTSARREKGGYIYRLLDGSYDIRLNPAGDHTPCSMYPGGPNPEPGEEVVASFHTHPFSHGDLLPQICNPDLPAGSQAFYDNVLRGGGSIRDWQSIESPYAGRQLPGYIIDKDMVFRLDPGTIPEERVYNPNRWEWNDLKCGWF